MAVVVFLTRAQARGEGKGSDVPNPGRKPGENERGDLPNPGRKPGENEEGAMCLTPGASPGK